MSLPPDALIDWPVDAVYYELVDIFNWKEEAAGMISQMEFVRRVDVQAETIERYVRVGMILVEENSPAEGNNAPFVIDNMDNTFQIKLATCFNEESLALLKSG